MKPLIVTPGDPRGIGPEVVEKALRHFRARPVVVVGPEMGLAGAAPVEELALRWAVAAIERGDGAALVTGPIHKARMAERGFAFTGHTDFLGSLLGVERPVMAFVGGAVRVSLVTVHLPLRAVADALSVEGIVHTVRASWKALRNDLGLEGPIAVCGLNPHAGDDGLLGREEIDVVGPAVEQCRREGIDAVGPWSAETCFRAAVRGEVQWVVAMYHDQGLAPLKALESSKVGLEHRSVNWTLGLPIVRTSVDHGTADDLVGRGVADEGSMVAALTLAHQLASRVDR